jgi:NAD(P)-dependent dehydrogenase (short-subunit alcohol dehydrogenase family)
MMRQLLEGKTAIVTGASKGIGKAIAELFAEEGASVVLTARGQQALDETVNGITASGGKAIGIVADSSDPAAPQRVFDAAIERFGQVDILVNNAGFGDMAPIEEVTDEHFEKVMAINLFGVFRYCREAARHFMPRNCGVIVNVSSVNGDKPVLGVAYTTSKGAVNTMTKNIAIRFSGTGIRCNAIAAGQTETDMDGARERGELQGGTRMWEFGEKYVNVTVPSTKPLDQA